ncbi:ABC transporter permease [Nonomuraea sp. NPDC050790]|uniref:ABC transporter permease n=1 Tax=Nonomuraea sp. NPDC050790 TaxID=3364371 RepID=UPI0037B2B740
MTAEWIKLRTLRSTWWCLAALAVLTAGLGTIMAGAAAEAARSGERLEPVAASLQGGLLFGQVAIGVLGVLAVTSEYAGATMRTSVLAVPRRGRLFLAKCAVVGSLGTAAGLLTAVASFLIGQHVFTVSGLPHATLGDPGALRSVLGAGLYLGMLGLFGLATGFLVRSTAGGVIVVVSATVLVIAILRLLPEWVSRIWPTVAGLSILSPDGDLWGFALYTAFVAVTLAAGLSVFYRRDAGA